MPFKSHEGCQIPFNILHRSSFYATWAPREWEFSSSDGFRQSCKILRRGEMMLRIFSFNMDGSFNFMQGKCIKARYESSLKRVEVTQKFLKSNRNLVLQVWYNIGEWNLRNWLRSLVQEWCVKREVVENYSEITATSVEWNLKFRWRWI